MSDVYDYNGLATSLDKEGMIGYTRNFVDDLKAAISADIGLSSDCDWNGVICLGMGGSGAGGSFLASLSYRYAGLPFISWKDYDLPNWWGPDWLVLATSYSGNTEETISGIRLALEGGGTVIGISSGGSLQEMVDGHEEAAWVEVPGGQPPRSAFGHLFGAQLNVCWSLGLLPRPDSDDLTGMFERLSTASRDSDFLNGGEMATQIASSLKGRQLGIISTPALASVGIRFVNQCNENAGSFARGVTIPEMHHNEVVAWDSPGVKEGQAIIMLVWNGVHERVAHRVEWTAEALDVDIAWRIDCEGDMLEAMLHGAHMTDWISLALALLNGKDPTSIGPISALKEHLGAIE